jgi:import inner membrane translocase subunit TIM21
VRESAFDLTYIVFGAFGILCLGTLAYMVITEFVMPNSPQAVFRRSLRLLRDNDAVCAYFGTPLRGFGEETRRGRRRNVTHLEYVKDGEERMRMVFYVRGPSGDGSVQLEMKMVSACAPTHAHGAADGHRQIRIPLFTRRIE